MRWHTPCALRWTRPRAVLRGCDAVLRAAHLHLGAQPAVSLERVRHARDDFAGEAHVAVFAHELERDVLPALVTTVIHLPPQAPIEALRPTVERVGAVVRRHGVVLAAERELGAADAIGDAADDAAKVRPAGLAPRVVVLRAVEAESDIYRAALRGHHEAHDCGAEVGHAEHEAMSVGERVQRGGALARNFAKWLARQRCHRYRNPCHSHRRPFPPHTTLTPLPPRSVARAP